MRNRLKAPALRAGRKVPCNAGIVDRRPRKVPGRVYLEIAAACNRPRPDQKARSAVTDPHQTRIETPLFPLLSIQDTVYSTRVDACSSSMPSDNTRIPPDTEVLIGDVNDR
jgi:hypothetical protein